MAGTRTRSPIWRPWTEIPVGDDPGQTTGALVVVLPTHIHLSHPQCCFSTALLSARIHSRPTAPAELRESTATYGIYGNLKILTSAIVLHTKYSVNSVHPTPTDFLLPVGHFFFFLNAA